MNGFYLIPTTTIVLEGGETSTFPKYWKYRYNPTGMEFKFSACRYGRADIWLLRVMNIAPEDAATLAAMPDVYTFPADDNLDFPISDKSTIDLFFEGFNIPTDWLTPSTSYRELLRALAHMAQILQRFFGIRGAELFDNATLETRFRDLDPADQAALQTAANELAGTSVPINPNQSLRSLLRAASNYTMGTPISVGDFLL